MVLNYVDHTFQKSEIRLHLARTHEELYLVN